MNTTKKDNHIVIYKDIFSEEVLIEFFNYADFEEWIEKGKNPNVDIFAEQCSINGNVLLGWDEMGDFLN